MLNESIFQKVKELTHSGYSFQFHEEGTQYSKVYVKQYGQPDSWRFIGTVRTLRKDTNKRLFDKAIQLLTEDGEL